MPDARAFADRGARLDYGSLVPAGRIIHLRERRSWQSLIVEMRAIRPTGRDRVGLPQYGHRADPLLSYESLTELTGDIGR